VQTSDTCVLNEMYLTLHKSQGQCHHRRHTITRQLQMTWLTNLIEMWVKMYTWNVACQVHMPVQCHHWRHTIILHLEMKWSTNLTYNYKWNGWQPWLKCEWKCIREMLLAEHILWIQCHHRRHTIILQLQMKWSTNLTYNYKWIGWQMI